MTPRLQPPVRTVLLAALIAASAFLCYLGSLNNGFIWDDPIVHEQQMVAFKTISDAFLPPANIPQYGIFYYRPLVVLSYMVDRAFTGPRPMELPKGAINPFHVSVVLYHVLVTVLVFFLGRLLFRTRPWGEWAAFAGALLFAVHPIHTESICWMAGRSDVLASVGLVPALILYLQGRIHGGIKWFVAAAAAFLVGLWAKETGIAAALALPALDLVPLGRANPAPPAPADPAQKKSAEKREKGRSVGRVVPSRTQTSWIGRYAPFGVAAVIYWFMRFSDLHRGVQGEDSFSTLLFSTHLQAQRDRLLIFLVDLVGAVGFYLRKVLVPTRLNAFVADVPHDALTLSVGAAGLAAGVVLFVLARRRGARMLPALAALFFATIAPSFAIATFDISETPVAERYLYIPSIFVCLGAGWLGGLLLEAVRQRMGPGPARIAFASLAGAGAVVFAVFAMATSVRNETWSDDIRFWTDAVEKEPRQGLPHLHLGLAYDKLPADNQADRTRYEEIAEREYLLALDEKKTVYDVEGRSTALNNIGNVYMSQGKYDKAEECFRKSFGMRPSYPTPYYGMGLVRYRQALETQKAGSNELAYQQMGDARTWLDQAIQRNSRYVKAILMSGIVRLALRDQSGLQYLQQVITLSPGTYEATQAERILTREQGKAAPAATP